MDTTNESITEPTNPITPEHTDSPDQPIADSAELQEAALTTVPDSSTPTHSTDTSTAPVTDTQATPEPAEDPVVTSTPSDDLFKVDFANTNTVPKLESIEQPIEDTLLAPVKTSTTSMTGSSDSYVMVAEATPTPPQTISESQILEDTEPKSKPEPDKEEWLDILGNGSLKKLVLEAGGSDKPTRGQRVSLDFTALLHQMDGMVVEEQTDFEVELGEADVVQGLDLAVPLMTLGEVAWVFMASRFGYGETGNGENIPANADLYCMVKLKQILPRYEYESMEEDKLIEVLEKKKLRGNTLYKLKQIPLAITVYSSAIRILNSHQYVSTPDGKIIGCRLLTNLAISQYKSENMDESLASCDKALALVPQDTKALYRKSVILTDKHEYEESIRCLEQAHVSSPGDTLVDRELKRVRSLHSESNRRQRNVYRRMMQAPIPYRPPIIETGSNRSRTAVLVASGVVAIAAVCIGLFLFKKS